MTSILISGCSVNDKVVYQIKQRIIGFLVDNSVDSEKGIDIIKKEFDLPIYVISELWTICKLEGQREIVFGFKGDV